MSEKQTPKWEADGFRIVYDPTPGGIPQEGGGRMFSLKIPALEVTEWVSDREKVAADIAKELNEASDKDAEIKRIQDLVTSSEQHRYRDAGVLIAKDAEIANLSAQNEWLKDRLSDLQLPANSHKNIEEWLVECGMPAGIKEAV